jgi:Tol biopolymer transport system component/DNA-binding winged helix-turn-helix (wHTH) protein
MAETQSRPQVVRFGAFEADVKTAELRKDGVKLKFSGQPFQVLAILLERPGEAVTREELQKRLWPDTFVDVERNLNTAVNKIREVLGDSAETPRFVETLPRRGYRFIAELHSTVRPVAAVDTVEPVRGRHHRQMWLKIGVSILVISVIALAALLAYRRTRHQGPQEQAVLTAVPFTALPGWAASPAFSPEGSRIAFAWSPGRGSKGFNQFDLYVKAVGSETLLRLTQHPSDALSPAWSPDGTQIAFYRQAGNDSGIYVVPALGGPEQKLHSTRAFNVIISWSPDGKWIAFEDLAPDENRRRIYLLSTETLATRRIPANPMCLGEGMPALSHNGESLAYWCFRNGFEARLYSFSMPDGKPKMIAPFWALPTGLTWSTDDTRLFYSEWNRKSSAGLGEVSVANGSAKRLGLEGISPAVSAKGDKLAYGSLSVPISIWRRDLLHTEAPAVELIRSSRPQYDAQYSPDEKHIAFASTRSGEMGVWISYEDGSNLVQISDPRSASGSPQWSPGGNKIVFDSFSRDHWEIHVADLAEGKPRKLVTNIAPAIRPSWSHDGKWIYFVSQQSGREGIYRCPASGGDATAVSKDINGINPQESFDGRTVYFGSVDRAGPLLKTVPLPGQPGTESEVDGLPRMRDGVTWRLSPGGIYFVPAEAPRSVRYFEFASKRIRTIFEVDHDLSSGLSVSPDGRWILYSQQGDVTGDIMLVDHFQ